MPKFHSRSRTHRGPREVRSAEKKKQITETNNRLKRGDFGSDYLVHIMPKI